MRGFLYIAVVFIMANLDAIVDRFMHPEIPYFHLEHLIIGGVTAGVTAVLLGIGHLYMIRQERSLDELRQRDSEVLAERNKLASILSVLDSGVTIRNLDYDLTYQNAYVTKIFGNHLGEKCYRAFQGIDNICNGCPVEIAIKSEKPHTSIRQVITPEGEITFWENVAIPIRNASGEIDSCLELNNNITERKRMEAEIFKVEKREQMRIGQDLHDDLGQILTGIAFKAKVIQDKISGDKPVEAEEMAEIVQYLNEAKQRTRLLAKGLLSLESDEGNLTHVFHDFAESVEKIYGISCDFTGDELVSIGNKSTVAHLYRIAQEAVTNAIKHGGPEHIDISLLRRNGNLELTITDNGKGTPDFAEGPQGMGLHIMHYRAGMIGATLDIRSDVHSGTSVRCTFPDDSDETR